MAKVNIVEEMLRAHNDEEIIEHLYRLLHNINKNYEISAKANCPEAMWGSLGDVQQAMSILGAMKQRNQNKLAQLEEQ